MVILSEILLTDISNAIRYIFKYDIHIVETVILGQILVATYRKIIKKKDLAFFLYRGAVVILSTIQIVAIIDIPNLNKGSFNWIKYISNYIKEYF